MNNTTFDSMRLDISFRDVACFAFAVAIHSLLLLWKGGLLNLPEKADDLGNMIVAVDFRSDIPNWDAAPGGGSAPRPTGLLARMKSILKGQGAAGEKKPQMAMGQQSKPEAPKWNTVGESLTNKPFAKDGLQGLKDKKNDMQIAVGQNKEIVEVPSQGNFKVANANLKENKFKIAKRDVPFPIVSPKNQDALQNVNAIPMNVGRATSANVKSLSGGIGAGPAMQSKTFASRGAMASASSFGGGGFGGSSGASGRSAGSGGGLAMGSSAGGGGTIAGAGVGGMGGGGASGYGSGDGTGYGNGRGNGVGNGVGAGGGGRSWGGRGSGGMTALPRNTVASEAPVGAKGSGSFKGSGFEITGALRGRGIVEKIKPPYEMDGRVALAFSVGWDGRVLDGIVVVISSGSPSFDQKVISALKQWTFVHLADNRTNEIQKGVITFVFKGV